jgi:DNA-binding MarR family transcriptional regulator
VSVRYGRMSQVEHPYYAHERPTPAPRPTAGWRAAWREARRFQIDAQKAIGRHAFYEWLLLETLQELLDETGDAVSQVEIAKRAGITKMMTSYWMTWMDEHGLVDRAPSFDGRAYRILFGERGREVLRVCNERLEAAGIRD